MEIKQTEQKLELTYTTGNFLIEGELEDRFIGGEGAVTYNRTLQAVARIDVNTTFTKVSGDPNNHEVTVEVTDGLMNDGFFVGGGFEHRKLGYIPHCDVPPEDEYCSELEGYLVAKVRENFCGYSSNIQIDVHSADLMNRINTNYEEGLVAPYLDKIIDQIVSDGQKLLSGGEQ